MIFFYKLALKHQFPKTCKGVLDFFYDKHNLQTYNNQIHTSPVQYFLNFCKNKYPKL